MSRGAGVAQDAIQYAYFASYSYQRHQSMVADLQSRDNVRLEMMGQTLDGHDLDILIVGAPSGNGHQTHVCLWDNRGGCSTRACCPSLPVSMICMC